MNACKIVNACKIRRRVDRQRDTDVNAGVFAGTVSHKLNSVVACREVDDKQAVSLAGAALVGRKVGVWQCQGCVTCLARRASPVTCPCPPTEVTSRVEAKRRYGRIIPALCNRVDKLCINRKLRPALRPAAASPVGTIARVRWPSSIERGHIAPTVERRGRRAGEAATPSGQDHDGHPPTRDPQPWKSR